MLQGKSLNIFLKNYHKSNFFLRIAGFIPMWYGIVILKLIMDSRTVELLFSEQLDNKIFNQW